MKKTTTIGCLIFLGIILVYIIIPILSFKLASEQTATILTVLIYMITIIGLLIALPISIVRRRKQKKKESRERAEKLKKKMQKIKAVDRINLEHATGLGIADKLECEVFYCKEEIVIESKGAVFHLPFKKIQSMEITTDVETDYESISYAGYRKEPFKEEFWGDAYLGVKPEIKEIRTYTYYFVITYKKKKEMKYVAFYADSANEAAGFVARYNMANKKEIEDKAHIEL